MLGSGLTGCWIDENDRGIWNQRSAGIRYGPVDRCVILGRRERSDKQAQHQQAEQTKASVIHSFLLKSFVPGSGFSACTKPSSPRTRALRWKLPVRHVSQLA